MIAGSIQLRTLCRLNAADPAVLKCCWLKSMFSSEINDIVNSLSALAAIEVSTGRAKLDLHYFRWSPLPQLRCSFPRAEPMSEKTCATSAIPPSRWLLQSGKPSTDSIAWSAFVRMILRAFTNRALVFQMA